MPDTSGELGLDAPNAARMYDYFFGGAQNFEVDRAAAKQALRSVPADVFARANRAFLRRSVRMMAEADVDQFLDLGSGLPTVGNVHEVAQRVNPAARIAYVDIDPVAAAQPLLAEVDQVRATQADIGAPDRVLADAGVAGLLDFTRPVAVLAFAVLHFLAEPEPAVALARYREACVPGSYLALSHLSQVRVTDEQVSATTSLCQGTPHPGDRAQQSDHHQPVHWLLPARTRCGTARPVAPTGQRR